MSYGIMEYLSFGTRLSARKLTERLMGEVRYLIRTHQWYFYQTMEEVQQAPYLGRDYAEVKTFFMRYKGQEMLVVILCFHNQWYVTDYGFNSFICCVFADDYVYTSQVLSFQKLWNLNLQWDEEIFENLSRYDAMHPQTGLAAYLGRYKQMKNSSVCFDPIQMNFLIPLFAQHHKGLELLVQAELYHLAGAMFRCDSGENPVLAKDQGTYSNLKEWLGVSHNVLKKLDQMLKDDNGRDDQLRTRFAGKGWWRITGRSRNTYRPLTNQEFFARLADIADYNSEYLNLLAFTPSVLQFYMENHLIHHKPKHGDYQISRHISGVARMTDQQVLMLIRYITELPGPEARDYMRYLDYCGKCKGLTVRDYPFGLRPRDTCHAAAKTLDMYEYLYGTELSKRFRYRIRAAAYQLLKSDKDGCVVVDDYCVSIPEEAEDLVRESDRLGHCVQDYCEAVANGSTYILFLRRADKPYVTMEVTKRYRLVQVKARENEPATLEAQQYVRRWAEQKGLIIDTDDLYETA
ncbi:PcfJ domain-containing protein [Bariatricus sp. HCP28S3_D3]|uniref:PcfJ domain-containing protein n=1 Tax=Bariatricus sp. HCP28S3_D3 TaxID=3438901 RepID=UPI003F8AA8CA